MQLGLESCTVGPDFHRPIDVSPPIWAGAASSGVMSNGAVDPTWWDSFHDRELSSLVERLVHQNIDLQSAAERVQQADAERQIARAQGLPNVDEQSSYKHERQSPTGFLTLIQPAPYAPLTYDVWQNGLNASWELDLFGRVRRAVEAQRADTEAAIEARHAVALDAIATLALDYLQLRGTETRIAVARRNLAVADHDLKLVRDQFANGVATTLSVAQAEAQRATIASTLPALEATEARLVNAIGLLLAEPPRALAAELEETATALSVPPVVPVGLPSALLRRRPDIREAEASLHAATANTGVAVAAFYPDVSLTGQFDENGRIVGNAFSLPSRAFTFGPSIDLPLFEGGRLVGTLRLRRSQQRQAALSYRNTVLTAWRDVDDAMTAYDHARRTRDDVALTVDADRKALSAATQGFQQGAVDFLNVTNAEASLLSGEDQLATANTNLETDLVSLYKALGGGWQIADSAQTR
ncbi:efflux transporter outer membrane subunit (plasmid) [Lichenicola cladoniae]|uniref:Efflux transporter outer membrane subunit n=2 Tax=Lichenicola cladoniae TaxID=1484109 RepID=A0A6M8HYC9_9PROT|nr:efflux transporter outer membrane subunit [Lichenicola cladoniae]NPD70314.1 efflux transporter outer membrane subunit [Acetobacteraceae bacterium]QKE93256.1 efflux transporter outer membrane subunit [Lichenicola cladoniae]